MNYPNELPSRKLKVDSKGNSKINSGVILFPVMKEKITSTSNVMTQSSIEKSDDAYTRTVSFINMNKEIQRKGDISMDWQEKYIDSLDKNVQEIKREIKETRAEIKQDFDSKLNQFMSELRDRDNQRHQEIIAMQQRIDNNISELKGDIKATQDNISKTNKWIMGLVISAVVSFIAVAVSVGFGIFSVIDIVRTLVAK